MTVTITESTNTVSITENTSPITVAESAVEPTVTENAVTLALSEPAVDLAISEEAITPTVSESTTTVTINSGVSHAGLSAHTDLTTTAHGDIVAEGDPRLSDPRTPTAHAATHATGQSDAMAAADIGAEPDLGNPSNDGDVLASTIAGTRPWTTPGGGGISDAPEDGTPYAREDLDWVAAIRKTIANTWSALQTFTSGILVSRSSFPVLELDGTGMVSGSEWITGKNAGTEVFSIVRGSSASRVQFKSAENLYFVPGSGATIFYNASGNNFILESSGGSRNYLGSSNGPVDIRTTGGAYSLYLGTNSVRRVTINGTTGHVGIAHSAPFGRLHVYTSTSTTKGLIVQGVASQSAPLTQWLDSSSSVIASVDENGEITAPKFTATGMDTSDPGVAGKFWNDGGTVKISAG